MGLIWERQKRKNKQTLVSGRMQVINIKRVRHHSKFMNFGVNDNRGNCWNQVSQEEFAGDLVDEAD